MYKYRRIVVKEYVVSFSAEYNVSCDAKDIFEAEDVAFNMIESELKKRDVDEIDIYILEEAPSIVGYHLRLKVNMIVPVYASNYEEAFNQAEFFVDGMQMPGNIHLISMEPYDVRLAEEKANLLRCKGA